MALNDLICCIKECIKDNISLGQISSLTGNIQNFSFFFLIFWCLKNQINTLQVGTPQMELLTRSAFIFLLWLWVCCRTNVAWAAVYWGQWWEWREEERTEPQTEAVYWFLLGKVWKEAWGKKNKHFFLFHFSFTFSHLSMHLTDKRGVSAVQEGQFIKGWRSNSSRDTEAVVRTEEGGKKREERTEPPWKNVGEGGRTVR